MKNSIEKLRNVLIEEFPDGEFAPVKLPFDQDILNVLLFDESYDGYKKFPINLNNILTKIDYSNVDFDNFFCKNFDFSPYIGIKINPQNIFYRSLAGAKCENVEFIGPFDNVDVRGTDFRGSKGAKINPQTINEKNLSGTKCGDVEFISFVEGVKPNFDGVNITESDFSGSNYEEAIKEEIEFRKKIKLLFSQNNIPR